MKELESYSIDELEQLTGANRRTISYYIAEGLLPKVGRRGPKTRYGREFADRLKFIQRVKGLQDAGKLPSITLSDIGVILNRLVDEDIAEGMRSQKRLLEIFTDGISARSPDPGAQFLVEGQADFSMLDELDSVSLSAVPRASTNIREPAISRASERRAMHKSLSSLSGVKSARDLVVSKLTGAPSEESADLFEEPLSAMREDADRGQQQLAEMHSEFSAVADEMNDLRQQLQQMRKENYDDMKGMGQLAREIAEMRNLVREEITGLRETLDELSFLRRHSTNTGGRTLLARTQNRARMWAERHGLSTKFMRIGTLRPHQGQPSRNVWTFPIDKKMLGMSMDITLLLEQRDQQGHHAGFVAAQVPMQALKEATRPLLKSAKGMRIFCVVSAESDDYLQGINCPGLDLNRYLHATTAD